MHSVHATVVQLTQMLGAIEKWLDKAEAHAKARSFEPALFLGSRIAVDQYPLVRQIQSACDAAKFAGARLSGKEAPKNPDTEQTLPEIRKRIADTIAFLGTLKEADYVGADKRMIPLPWMPGKGLTGHDYLTQLSVPNFFFHFTHVYAILRNAGVELGKQDFITTLSLKDVLELSIHLTFRANTARVTNGQILEPGRRGRRGQGCLPSLLGGLGASMSLAGGALSIRLRLRAAKDGWSRRAPRADRARRARGECARCRRASGRRAR